MALRSVVISEADQPAHTQALIVMLLAVCPVCKEDLRLLVQSLPFHHHYVAILEGKINALKEGGSALWQDWSSIHKYITDQMVREWANENISKEMLTWQLLNFVCKMGLRKPNQATFQALTAIMLILKNGTSWNATEKKRLFDHVKVEFKRSTPQHFAGQIYIGNLPESPQLLHTLIPISWWTHVFGKPFEHINFIVYDSQMFDRIVSSVAMRNTRTDVRDTVLRGPAPADGNMMIGNMMMALMGQAPGPAGGLPDMARMLQNVLRGQAPAQPLARALSGLETEPNICFIPRVPPPGAPSVLMDAAALAGPGGANAAGALAGPAGEYRQHSGEDPAGEDPAGSIVSTAAGAAENERMTLQAVAQSLGEHAKGARKKPATKVMKKPASAKGGDWSKANREHGCPKCRGKPGCTPSCIK